MEQCRRVPHGISGVCMVESFAAFAQLQGQIARPTTSNDHEARQHRAIKLTALRISIRRPAKFINLQVSDHWACTSTHGEDENYTHRSSAPIPGISRGTGKPDIHPTPTCSVVAKGLTPPTSSMRPSLSSSSVGNLTPAWAACWPCTRRGHTEEPELVKITTDMIRVSVIVGRNGWYRQSAVQHSRRARAVAMPVPAMGTISMVDQIPGVDSQLGVACSAWGLHQVTDSTRGRGHATGMRVELRSRKERLCPHTLAEQCFPSLSSLSLR